MADRFLGKRLIVAMSQYLLFAVVHSLLTIMPIKTWARQVGGERYGNALYRLIYNAIALISLFGVIRAFLHMPDKGWYQSMPPWSWLLRAGQASGVLLGIWGVLAGGIGEFTGFRPVAQFLRGDVPASTQEGHGPRWKDSKQLVVRGPFHITRHPANWGMALIMLLNPRMSRNRAAFTLLSCAYLILGSLHEEQRMQATYQGDYDTYKQHVPFLFKLLTHTHA